MSASIVPKVAVVAAVMLSMGGADAALSVYTTQASFLAAAGRAATDTFDDLELDFVGSPLERTVGGFGYAATSAGFFGAGSAADVWLSTNDAFEPIVFASFTGAPRAVGGFFFATAASGAALPGQSVVVTAVDAGGPAARTLANPGPVTFLGFVSDGALASLTVAAVDGGSVAAFATVDDFVLAAAAAVPETETGVLLLGGLAALGLRMRRRR
jgi:hypothetical protein